MHPSPTADTSSPWLPNFRLANMSRWMLAHLPPVQPPAELQVDGLQSALVYRKQEMPEQEQNSTGRSWILSITSFLFILLQSACTAVMAISGVRVIIGLGALAAAAGLNRPASGFHADAIRIPMMAIAVIGSFVNVCDLEDTQPALPAFIAVAHNPCNPQTEAGGSLPDWACGPNPGPRAGGVITHRIVHNA